MRRPLKRSTDLEENHDTVDKICHMFLSKEECMHFAEQVTSFCRSCRHSWGYSGERSFSPGVGGWHGRSGDILMWVRICGRRYVSRPDGELGAVAVG